MIFAFEQAVAGEKVLPAVREVAAEMVALRHRIHAHSELAYEEFETSQLVADSLKAWGYEVHQGLAGTGVVGTLRMGDSARRLGLRADMDALPIHENTGLPYASQLPGKMHACGHDGHTAILLTAARCIAQERTFDGTLHLIIQPAEEGLGGGRRMVEEGLFEKFPCDAIFALHNMPGFPVGKFGFKEGSFMASSDSVSITVHGRGGMALTLSLPARAQAGYPSKPVKVLVGYAPGGAVDMVARVVADILAAKLGGTVVVDNAPGAAGVLAAQKTVNSAPDGYTLLVGSSNELAATGLVNTAQKYDPLKDITPLGLIGRTPALLVAGPHIPVKNTDQFLDLLKRHPGKYSYGSSGVGSTLHFAGELIKQQAGVFMAHIPYRGTATLTSDLVGGTLDFAMVTPTAAAPFIKAGRITALGVTSTTRFPALP